VPPRNHVAQDYSCLAIERTADFGVGNAVGEQFHFGSFIFGIKIENSGLMRRLCSLRSSFSLKPGELIRYVIFIFPTNGRNVSHSFVHSKRSKLIEAQPRAARSRLSETGFLVSSGSLGHIPIIRTWPHRVVCRRTRRDRNPPRPAIGMQYSYGRSLRWVNGDRDRRLFQSHEPFRWQSRRRRKFGSERRY
jgi:hypothetical protein